MHFALVYDLYWYTQGNILYTQGYHVTTSHQPVAMHFYLGRKNFLLLQPLIFTTAIESLHHSNWRMVKNNLTVVIEDAVIEE